MHSCLFLLHTHTGFVVTTEKIEIYTRARATHFAVGPRQCRQDNSTKASSKWGRQPHYAYSGTVFRRYSFV